MNEFTNYFEHITSLHRFIILVSGIALFWLIEDSVPLFSFHYKKWKHAFNNFALTLTTILINFVFAGLLGLTAQLSASYHIGLFHQVHLNWLLQILVGFLALDLIGAWFSHYCSHRYKWLWQLHLIHHTDEAIDTTTATRHHPLESLQRVVFTAAAIFLVGTPLWLVFLYQSCSAFFSQFNHANIELPKWLNQPLSWLIITPNMHHVHHHYQQPFTDSNYGNIFAFWDRLLGTYKMLEAKNLKYGIDTYTTNETKSLLSLLTLPFKGYRSNKKKFEN